MCIIGTKPNLRKARHNRGEKSAAASAQLVGQELHQRELTERAAPVGGHGIEVNVDSQLPSTSSRISAVTMSTWSAVTT
jgi:hypothetical protein